MKGTSMKKIISFILSFFLLTAAGCGEEKTADTQDMQVLNLFSFSLAKKAAQKTTTHKQPPKKRKSKSKER